LLLPRNFVRGVLCAAVCSGGLAVSSAGNTSDASGSPGLPLIVACVRSQSARIPVSQLSSAWPPGTKLEELPVEKAKQFIQEDGGKGYTWEAPGTRGAIVITEGRKTGCSVLVRGAEGKLLADIFHSWLTVEGSPYHAPFHLLRESRLDGRTVRVYKGEAKDFITGEAKGFPLNAMVSYTTGKSDASAGTAEVKASATITVAD
jgi:hypothetical protein